MTSGVGTEKVLAVSVGGGRVSLIDWVESGSTKGSLLCWLVRLIPFLTPRIFSFLRTRIFYKKEMCPF